MVQYRQQPTQPAPVVPVQLVQPITTQPVPPQTEQQLPASNDEGSLFSDPEAESSSSRYDAFNL